MKQDRRFQPACLVLVIACLVSGGLLILALPSVGATDAAVSANLTSIATLTNSTNSSIDSTRPISVHAAGRGNPWINLGDGRGTAKRFL